MPTKFIELVIDENTLIASLRVDGKTYAIGQECPPDDTCYEAMNRLLRSAVMTLRAIENGEEV